MGKEGGKEEAERERERKREIEKNTLREKGEQYYFLGESCFLRSLCVKFVAHLYLNTSSIPPYNCSQEEFIVVVLSHLLQILLT